MTIATRVQDFLSRRQTELTLVPHARTGSARETAAEAHVPDDHLAKAVVTRDAGGFCMAVIPASAWLRLDALGAELNRDLQLAPEGEIPAMFPDCRPGALPPFGWLYGMETCLDLDLTTLADVYFEAGDHEHLVRVSGETFCALMQGARHGHFSRD